MKIPVAGQLSALPELPAVRVSIEAGERPGRELAQVAGEGEQLARQWQAVEQELELARETANTSKFLMEMDEEMQGRLERPDTTVSPAEASAAFRKEFAQKAEQFVAPMPNAVIRSRILTQLNHHINTRAIEYRTQAVKVHREQILGEFIQAGEKVQQEYARTGDREKVALHLAWLDDLVSTGIVHADKAAEIRQKFVAAAENNRVDHDLMVNPYQTLKDIADDKYLLDEDQKFAGSTRAQARITHLNTQNKEARNAAEDDFKRDMILALEAGVFGTGDKIDKARILGLLRGHTSGAVDHVLAKVASVEKAENKLEMKASGDLASEYRRKIRDTTTAAQATGLMRAAELENMLPKDLEAVDTAYQHQLTHLDAMTKRATDEQSNRIKEQEAQKAQARHEANIWLPSLHAYEIKADPDMYDARAKTQDRIEASIDQEASAGRNPVEWVRKNRVSIQLGFYKSAEAAYNAKKSELLSYGYKTPDELRAAIMSGRVPPEQAKHLKELTRNLKDLNEWLAKNKPGKE